MANQPINHNIDAVHLKNVFEQSLAMLGEPEVAIYGNSVPLRGNAVPIHIDPAMLQKRALDDAAKALATLWRVPETRLQSRSLQNRKVS